MVYNSILYVQKADRGMASQIQQGSLPRRLVGPSLRPLSLFFWLAHPIAIQFPSATVDVPPSLPSPRSGKRSENWPFFAYVACFLSLKLISERK